MKNIFFALALISTASVVQAEVSIETIKAGAVCVVENEGNKAGCPICPEEKDGKPKKHENEEVNDEEVNGEEANIEEESDDVKCGCSKPKPGKGAGE